jgi:large subunit ribosomal protein L21
MFAIVRTGGKQYRVAPGDKIVVEKLDGNAGDSITISDVLLAGDGSDLKSTDGLTVGAEIIAQAKGDKVTVFKKRRRHNYRRKAGHRQQHTILRIVSIGDQKAEQTAPAKKAAKAPAEAPAATDAPAPAAEAPAAPKKTKAKAAPVDNSEAVSSEGVVAADAGTDATNDVSTQNAAPAKGKGKKAAPAATQTEE